MKNIVQDIQEIYGDLKSVPPEYNATTIPLRLCDTRNVGCTGGGEYKYQVHQNSLLNTTERSQCIVLVLAKGLAVFSVTKF
jgi:hypothetical protein